MVKKSKIRGRPHKLTKTSNFSNLYLCLKEVTLSGLQRGGLYKPDHFVQG
jgi:hypothetical protein